MNFSELLTAAVEKNASDLLIMVGDKPAMRIAGQWHRFEVAPCKAPEVEEIVRMLLGNDLDDFRKKKECDFSRSLPPAGRVRCNVHYQRDHLAMVLRLVWPTLPDPRKLGIPPHVIAMGEQPHGLILISGPTGSGKSTTLAAIVEHINQNRPAHIITIEDPIEYMYKNSRSIIEQREVGSDTHSWHNALRSVLRQAPDVIVLGELRDLQSIHIALQAAETGHLVLASVHSSTAAGAIPRMVDVFPASQAAQVRMQLAQSIRMVFAQRLMPGREPDTRVLVYETLIGTPAISNLIRQNEFEQIPNMISAGREHGMISFAQCLRDLALRGLIAPNAVP